VSLHNVVYLQHIEFQTRVYRNIIPDANLLEGREALLGCHAEKQWVDLWHLPLVEESPIEQALLELRASEVIRANKIRAPEARSHFIQDHAWRNRIMNLYGNAKAKYTLRCSRLGKDLLFGEQAPSVSFSRTGSRAVVAVSNLARIGVDIEERGESAQWYSIAEIVDAKDWPAACSSNNDRAGWICRQFVIKEALLKGIGVGLQFPLHAIKLGFSAEGTAVYKKTTGRTQARPTNWHVISEMEHSYSLALAIKAGQTPQALAVSQYHCAPLDASRILRKDETVFFL